MSVIILLLIASLSVALLFLGAFIWSVRHRQFEDEYSPPLRILFDDAPQSKILPEMPLAGEKKKDPNPTNQ
jgi:cbb3-type cytochrome oxidase maturation protein